MSNTIVSKAQLEELECECCRGKDLSILLCPRCHPASHVYVRYFAGMIQIVCAECETIVATLEVK